MRFLCWSSSSRSETIAGLADGDAAYLFVQPLERYIRGRHAVELALRARFFEKGHGVGHHPGFTAALVDVRLRPPRLTRRGGRFVPIFFPVTVVVGREVGGCDLAVRSDVIIRTQRLRG